MAECRIQDYKWLLLDMVQPGRMGQFSKGVVIPSAQFWREETAFPRRYFFAACPSMNVIQVSLSEEISNFRL